MATSFTLGNHYSLDTYRVSGVNPSGMSTRISDTPAVSTDIHVDLSGLGRALASGTGNSQNTKEAKLQKIDESSFSKEMKDVMKRIVELKDQLEKKEQELQKVIKDQSLSDEQRQQRISSLQSEISTLSSALQSAMGMLSKNMQAEGLDSEAAVEVAGLIF